MFEPGKLDEVIRRMSEALENSPAKDIEKNVKALMGNALLRMDVVPRAEFETQAQVIARLSERLDALEARVVALEARLGVSPAAE